jgi:hypothetical protein
MPFAIPPGMQGCKQNVEWYSDTPLDATAALEALYYTSPRAKNGFAMLTLSKDGITEEAYDVGNTKPVWRREVDNKPGADTPVSGTAVTLYRWTPPASD